MYTDGMDIVMDDVITGEQTQIKTVSDLFLPHIGSMFINIADLETNPDVIRKYSYVNNTKFIIHNCKHPSFYFPKYVKELIECCYIVSDWWGATLNEIGWTITGYQVQFVDVGDWA